MLDKVLDSADLWGWVQNGGSYCSSLAVLHYAFFFCQSVYCTTKKAQFLDCFEKGVEGYKCVSWINCLNFYTFESVPVTYLSKTCEVAVKCGFFLRCERRCGLFQTTPVVPMFAYIHPVHPLLLYVCTVRLCKFSHNFFSKYALIHCFHQSFGGVRRAI